VRRQTSLQVHRSVDVSYIHTACLTTGRSGGVWASYSAGLCSTCVCVCGCEFVEVSTVLNYKLDELLVGIVTQIRLRRRRAASSRMAVVMATGLVLTGLELLLELGLASVRGWPSSWLVNSAGLGLRLG